MPRQKPKVVYVKNLRKKRRKPFAKRVRSILDRSLETKFLNTNIVGNIPNTGVVTRLDNVDIGTGVTERIGFKTSIKSLSWNAVIQQNQTDADAGNIGTKVRLILAIDTDDIGATTNLFTEFWNTSSPGVTDFRNQEISKFKRWRVLFDRIYTFNPLGQTSYNIRYYKRFKVPLKVYYRTATGSNGGTNRLILIRYSNLGANEPGLTSDAQVKYTDA